MYTVSFNFHNFISVNIVSSSHKFRRFFKNQYSRYGMPYSAPLNSAKINLYFTKNLPLVNPNDVYKKTIFKNLFKCEYVVQNLNTNNINIYFKRSLLNSIYVKPFATFIRAYVLHPLLYYVLLSRNILFLGVGLAFNKNGLVFYGQSGAGKTSLCISLLQRGFDFVAEDMLFINPHKKTLYGGEHKVLVSTHNIRNMNLNVFHIALLHFKKRVCPILELITNKRFQPRVWVSPEFVNPEMRFSPPVKYEMLLIVKASGVNASINLDDDGIEKLLKTFASNTLRIERLYAYVLFNNADLIERTKKKEAALLKEFFSGLSSAEYINTRTMEDKDLDQLAERLKNISLKE